MLHGSREFLRLLLTVSAAGDDDVNLDGATVEVRVGEDPTWRPAEVVSRVITPGGVASVRARLLVGAGTDLDLGVGEHRVLARLTTAAEATVVEARPWLSVASG